LGICRGFRLLIWLPGTTAFIKFSDWVEESIILEGWQFAVMGCYRSCSIQWQTENRFQLCNCSCLVL